MKSLVAHQFLIVDTDVSFACQLALAIKEAGGESTIVSTSLQAISCLTNFGADIVLCGKLSFRDTNLLLGWCAENTEFNTKVVQLVTTAAESDHCLSLSYTEVEEIIEQLPQLLFGMNDFMKLISGECEQSQISYQLKLPQAMLSLEPLEVTVEGIYFSSEESFAFEDVKALKVSFNHSDKSFHLPGVMEYHSKAGPFFRVHPHYQLQWDLVLLSFKNKQDDISGFLKKAAGF